MAARTKPRLRWRVLSVLAVVGVLGAMVAIDQAHRDEPNHAADPPSEDSAVEPQPGEVSNVTDEDVASIYYEHGFEIGQSMTVDGLAVEEICAHVAGELEPLQLDGVYFDPYKNETVITATSASQARQRAYWGCESAVLMNQLQGS